VALTHEGGITGRTYLPKRERSRPQNTRKTGGLIGFLEGGFPEKERSPKALKKGGGFPLEGGKRPLHRPKEGERGTKEGSQLGESENSSISFGSISIGRNM